ncbi:MAG: hypothetical protein ACK41C_20325 [Phenylobacterium sp.]|uniref:hypothetical protein n=1 Tax=Phenylobacterium sp. TaxID=1871053 RepID=UPI0039193267
MSWFQLVKKFTLMELEDGSGGTFLHVSVLKPAGYVSVPAGTTMRGRIQEDRRNRRVAKVLHVDTSAAYALEPPAVLRNRTAEQPDSPLIEYCISIALKRPSNVVGTVEMR